MSLAAGLAWYLASLVSPQRIPYFAPLAVVITFQTTVAETVAKAWYRCAGIVGGVAVALLLSHWLHPGAVTIALAVMLGTALSTALDLDGQISYQVGVTAVMVLASSGTPHYAEYRLLETALGAVVGVGVNALLLPPNGLPNAERRVLAVADLLSASLVYLSRAPLAAGSLVEPTAKQIEEQMSRAHQALRTAAAGFKLNPFAAAGRARLGELTKVMGDLEKIGIQVRGIARGLDDLGARTGCYPTGLSDALRETAAVLAAYRQAVERPSAEASRAVAAAVARAQSSQADCLTALREALSLADLRDLSAILADLDRILTEVSRETRREPKQILPAQSVAFGHD